MAETFPHTPIQALTMLYLQSHDISDLTSEELYDKYIEVSQKMSERYKDISNQKDEPKPDQPVFKFSRPM